MTNKELADLLLPNVSSDIEQYEIKYPKRDLKEGAIVTRFAPSPTGFVHMGSLFTSFICRKVATDTNGVFFLRIEDTDQKRQVENGVKGIVDDLKNFKIEIDEGMLTEEEEKGNYGTYTQSKRKEIYQTFVKYLLENGKAYPCFCSAEEIEDIRLIQEKKKQRIGYYGRFAKCRKLTPEEIKNKVEAGESYIIRLKSMGDFEKKVRINDLVKGELEFPENDIDVVIMKSDGLPTYHFAHLVDDHLMRTTHITRGEEWLPSLPIHIELFETMNWKKPTYAHLPVIMKLDNGNRRKLSKRKDMEAAVSYFLELGYPKDGFMEYLYTIANSNFEAWRDEHPGVSRDEFKMSFDKMSLDGALFDLAKIQNLCKEKLGHMTTKEITEASLAWAKEYDEEFYNLINEIK